MSNAKKSFLWNSIASMINALQAVILGMVITRTNGLQDAGVLALAFSLGNLFLKMGIFGVRKYQVTDISGVYRFSDYFVLRIMTALAMILGIAFYIIFVGGSRHYSADKNIAIIMMCLIYTMESVEDVFAGLYQRNDRLDLGGKIYSLRWGMVLVAYSCILYFRKDFTLASIVGAAVSLLILVFTISITFPKFDIRIEFRFSKQVKGLLKVCLPIFLVDFLAYYVNSSLKISIDKYLSDEIQACFGFVSMPIFAIDTFSSMLYMPTLVDMAKEWEQGEVRKVSSRMFKQCLLLLGITTILLVGAFFLGVPVLSAVFSTDLTDYKFALLILLIAGLFMAYTGFFAVIMITMRKQSNMLVGYVIIAVIAFVFCNPIVREYGVNGACLFYMALMGLQAVVFGVWCAYYLKRKKIK